MWTANLLISNKGSVLHHQRFESQQQQPANIKRKVISRKQIIDLFVEVGRFCENQGKVKQLL
jgi:hypothetical protein